MQTTVDFRSRTLRAARKASVLVLVALLLGLPALVGAGAGDLDLTFGSGGKITTDFFGFADRFTAVTIQTDGKIVAVGSALTGPGGTTRDNPSNVAIARYNGDGSLDGGFGSSGKVVLTSFGLGEARAVAIQSDGRIVLAGYIQVGLDDNFVLARLNTDGTLDSSFGSAGKVVTDFFGSIDRAGGLALQTDGKIVAAGFANSGTNGLDFAVARYQSDGSLDSTFGVGGKVTADFFGGLDIGNGIAIQPDGRLLVGGNAFIGSGSNVNNFGLIRLNNDGSLDATFGTGGKVNTDFGDVDEAAGLVLQSDGNIVLAGRSAIGGAVNFSLARYTAAGSLDGSFGVGGKVLTAFPGGLSEASAVVIQPNGKIVAAGRYVVSLFSQFALARYNANGSLDPTFGAGGLVTTDFAGTTDNGLGLAIQLDGKLVAVGTTGNDANSLDSAIARYQADGGGVESCIQDDSSRSILQFNATTGEYQFTDCQGLTVSGTAIVSRRGCNITLQHNGSDRRVLIRVDDCRKTGNASIQLFSQSRTFTITDRNTANNTCSCPAT